MQNLMHKAWSHFESGQLKTSYQLYIQALLSAIEELGKLEFNNQRKFLFGNLK
ncbi:hypothetical protein RO3G_00770 [Rhizopus delemar RA 99-880]|uniref:Uncharacterized protein n=1 Tax=Rhizopus delemar (strain RA 99-880 / ATCC MYA-4621 / FGSC 9543 / NRRL 43880) TaxID=246409 RepID=I1BIN6_RHIO9|nr:hypothetical protein RO3G_00770 [Rhizopus delemar RA 99-880]|eukprot:EIE76066.1 hypothetical protein RO3G_00770 [Rhizopus delemar RA 99-880]